MLFDTVDCPYCGHKNDMSDAMCDGISDDNTFDHECVSCEQEFEVYVEFDPRYSASKIEYADCDICGESSREIRTERNGNSFPKKHKGKKLCPSCWGRALIEEMSCQCPF